MDSIISKPEAIIFDWDNTLVDYWAVVNEALSFVLQHFELAGSFSAENLKHYACNYALRDYFPKIFQNEWQQAKKLYYSYVRQYHLDKIKPLTGAKETIDLLQQTEVPLCIVSNKDGKILRQEVEYLGWEPYFQSVIGSNDLYYDKPHPKPLLHSLSVIGITPGPSVWMIGDGKADVESAIAAGCLPILFGYNAEIQNMLLNLKEHSELQAFINKIFYR